MPPCEQYRAALSTFDKSLHAHEIFVHFLHRKRDWSQLGDPCAGESGQLFAIVSACLQNSARRCNAAAADAFRFFSGYFCLLA